MAGRNTLLDTASQERNDKRSKKKSTPLLDIIKRLFGRGKKKAEKGKKGGTDVVSAKGHKMEYNKEKQGPKPLNERYTERDAKNKAGAKGRVEARKKAGYPSSPQSLAHMKLDEPKYSPINLDYQKEKQGPKKRKKKSMEQGYDG